MVLPARSLPPRPSLEWLRKAAKDHLRALRAERAGATLAQAQRDVARQYGFRSWRALRAQVDGLATAAADAVTGPFLKRVGAGDIDAVRTALGADPGLVNAVGPHPFWGGPAAGAAPGRGVRPPRAVRPAARRRRRDRRAQRGYDHWSPLALAIDHDRPGMRGTLLERGAPSDCSRRCCWATTRPCGDC